MLIPSSLPVMNRRNPLWSAGRWSQTHHFAGVHSLQASEDVAHGLCRGLLQSTHVLLKGLDCGPRIPQVLPMKRNAVINKLTEQQEVVVTAVSRVRRVRASMGVGVCP